MSTGAGAATGTAEPVVRRVEQVMGLPVSLALRGRHARSPEGEAAWQRALDVLREADRVFSTWRDDSVVSRLHRGETTLAGCPPAVATDVAEVLRLGEQARRDSGGAFDVHRDGRLDPSGVVKGWAAERAAAALLALPGTDVCLSAGGDLLCRTRPGRPGWRIGVEDPRDPSRVVAVVPVRDGAVATSGTSHRGQHLRHAVTGAAPTGVASVTVVHPSLTVADVEATAAYLQEAGAARWLRERGRTGVVVLPDGTAEVVGPAGPQPMPSVRATWSPPISRTTAGSPTTISWSVARDMPT